MNKVVVRIRGGIGNQLFCYAAARRMALVNEAELVIDNVTGFARDAKYRRQYNLDRFRIEARLATPRERLQPFERYRRGAKKLLSRRRQFAERAYLEQETLAFDSRLLSIRPNGTIYIDGYWQSENYFKDVESVIRRDLRFIPPTDVPNHLMAKSISSKEAVAVHVRWFDDPRKPSAYNLSTDYYYRAIATIERRVQHPHYFVFSDIPGAARARLALPEGRATYISHNQGVHAAHSDLWLMAQCRHFIIANSTFSWWGSWLAKAPEKTVIAPGSVIGDGKTSWGFPGLIPPEWLVL